MAIQWKMEKRTNMCSVSFGSATMQHQMKFEYMLFGVSACTEHRVSGRLFFSQPRILSSFTLMTTLKSRQIARCFFLSFSMRQRPKQESVGQRKTAIGC